MNVIQLTTAQSVFGVKSHVPGSFEQEPQHELVMSRLAPN
jgi:hypothetical protein